MTDPHADLRAMLETPPSGDITRDAEAMGRWLLHMDFLDEVRALLEERDRLADEAGQLSDDADWLSEINEALGDDRNRAPFIDDAVRLLRKERDALKAEVERLRAKPVTPEQLFSSSKVIWEGWVRARDEEGGCVLDLFNGRVDRSRYVRVVEADQPQKPVHHKWPADPVEPAKPAEPISDELRLRCELAGRLIPAWVVEGHFNNHNVTNVEVAKVAHNIADALIAEARRRKEAKP